MGCKLTMTYRRVVAGRRGGPEVLEVVEAPLPEPEPGQARVRIQAAGVSYADILMREGVHPETPAGPFTPGWDLAGVVDALGPGVDGWQPGQAVAAMPVTGGYAEYLCLPAAELVPVPAGLDPAEVACIVFNYVTAYQMLHRSVHLGRGQRILVHAAAGGIGTALLQLGRLAGLELYGTASAAKHGLLASLGCTAIDYRTTDFVAEIRRLTGDGMDAVFDGIGGQHLWRSYRALRRGGRVVFYGLTSSLAADGRLAGGRRGRLRGLILPTLGMALSRLLPNGKAMTLYSVQTLRRRKPELYRQDVAVLLDLLARGQIKPLIAGRLSLSQARQAHELLGSGSVVGKLVLADQSAATAGSSA